MAHSFQKQPAFMVFQSTVRPFPIQPLADSARDLGDTEGGVIAGRLTHQGDIFGGKTASGKADDGEIVHETSEKQGLRTVGYQIQHDRNRRPEQLRDPIEGVFALLTACGQNADQNLLGLRAIFGPIAAPGICVYRPSWREFCRFDLPFTTDQTPLDLEPSPKTPAALSAVI